MKHILRLTAILIIVFTIIFFGVFFTMKPVIMRYAVSDAETIMLNSANKAILDVLIENNVEYNDIVTLKTNQEGSIIGLETNVYNLNKFKSSISNKIAEIIDQKKYFFLEIPIGTFLGNTYFSGFGPKIKFKMQLTSTAFIDFNHEFKDAGINQVLHIINVDIDIKGSLVIVGYNKGITASTTAACAQTVIVGNTPDAYTNVIESEKDNTGGLINDYGAIVE